MKVGLLSVSIDKPNGVKTAGELSAEFGFPEKRYKEELNFYQKGIAIREDEHPSDFCERSARRVLRDAGIDKDQVGQVFYSGVSKDYPTGWSGAIEATHRLGLENCLAFEVQNGCSGTLLAMHLASTSFSRKRPYSLILGAERWAHTISPQVNIPIGTTAHGDGGGACLVGPTEDSHFAEIVSHTAGENNGFIYTPAGGSKEPLSMEAVAAGKHFRTKRFDRNIVATYIKNYVQTLNMSVDKNGIRKEDISFLVMNHMRESMRAQICQEFGIPLEKSFSQYKYSGHVGSADIFFSLTSFFRKKSGSGIGLIAASSPSFFAALPLFFDRECKVPISENDVGNEAR